MGRFAVTRTRCGKRQRSPSSSTAAVYLTLRSGRRVPACVPRSTNRCGAKSSHCGIKSVRQRCRVGVTPSELLKDGSRLPEQADEAPATVLRDGCGCGGDNREDADNWLVMARSPPLPEAEMEAFFAAAELAERRRFVDTYNYDVALDRPLEGRFEWASVN